MKKKYTIVFALILIFIYFVVPTAYAVLPRAGPIVASVIDVRGDQNKLRPVELPNVESEITIDQKLATGDKLRTGPFGLLAIFFDDETAIRIHRLSDLEIIYSGKDNKEKGTRLRLNRGSVWSRVLRGPSTHGMIFETPTATAAIEGTDWFLKVDEQNITRLVVLRGNVDFFNEFGKVTISAGEQGVAEPGKAPSKRILVKPKDQPFWVQDVTLEWFNMLPLFEGPIGDLKSKEIPSKFLDRAEWYYDLGDLAASRSVLEKLKEEPKSISGTGIDSARTSFIQGLLLIREHRLDEAQSLLAESAKNLKDRRRMIAKLAIVGIHVEKGEITAADLMLRKIEAEKIDAPEVVMSRAWLHLFAGDYEKSGVVIAAVRSRYPEHARAMVLSAQYYTLIGESDQVAEQNTVALVNDPKDYLVWHQQAVYFHKLKPNYKAANEAYRKALELNPFYSIAWNDFGLLEIDQGDYQKGEESLRRAIELDPKNPLFHANLGSVLLVQERMHDAEQAFSTANLLSPNYPEALAGKGLIAKKTGNLDDGLLYLSKANLAEPSNSDFGVLLGEAFYDNGRVDEAQKTLDNVARIDTNDPIAPLLQSVIALDRAEAGQAIRYARKSRKRMESTGTLNLEGIASTQAGIINVGSAYANLGLSDWGRYYGELGFNPYSANSHFFLSTQYPSARANSSANTLGLLLDPTAVSFPNRYTEFVRTPRFDADIRGEIGQEGDGFTHNEAIRLQGFARIPRPFAYRIEAEHARKDGFRENSAFDLERISLGLGGWLDETNYLLFRSNYRRKLEGVPDSIENPDPDDRDETETLQGEIGYQHRFNADNKLLFRFGVDNTKADFTNPRSFGTGLSPLAFSLISNLGLENTRLVSDLGIFDGTSLYGNLNVFPLGSFGRLLGLPEIPLNIPNRLDLKNIRSISQEDTAFILQGRHLFSVDEIDYTYGFDIGTFRTESNIKTGMFQLSDFALLSGFGGSTIIDLGENRLFGLEEKIDSSAASFYLGASINAFEDLRIDAYGFVRYLDDGVGNRHSKIDPKLGLAWKLFNNHWLRVTIQRELISKFVETLAPVTAVGLVPPDDFVTVGSEISDYQVRWDAEWSPRIYTFLQFEEQRIDRFSKAIPLAFTNSVDIDETRLRAVSGGANLWLGERIGLFGRYKHTWTENRTPGKFSGNELPLVPEEQAEFGLTYLDPAQIRVSIAQSYIGQRPGNIENSFNLEGYWRTDIAANWQPWDRHLSVTAGVNNLFDKEFEFAKGFPSPGITSFLSVEYRF